MLVAAVRAADAVQTVRVRPRLSRSVVSNFKILASSLYRWSTKGVCVEDGGGSRDGTTAWCGGTGVMPCGCNCRNDVPL